VGLSRLIPPFSAQARNASDASCHCTPGLSTRASPYRVLRHRDTGLAMRRFGPQAQLGVLRRKRLRVRLGDRLAPLHRTVAIGAHLTPPKMEAREGAMFSIYDRSLVLVNGQTPLNCCRTDTSGLRRQANGQT
jgi:hypothetical protein